MTTADFPTSHNMSWVCAMRGSTCMQNVGDMTKDPKGKFLTTMKRSPPSHSPSTLGWQPLWQKHELPYEQYCAHPTVLCAKRFRIDAGGDKFELECPICYLSLVVDVRSTWACSTCHYRNKASAEKCMGCEATRPPQEDAHKPEQPMCIAMCTDVCGCTPPL